MGMRKSTTFWLAWRTCFPHGRTIFPATISVMRVPCRSPWGTTELIYNVSHRTTYRYTSPVSVGEHVACLKPRSFSQNRLVRNTLRIQPTPSTLTERADYFGNIFSFFTVEEPHNELIVEAKSQVNVDRQPASSASLSRPWEESAKHL